MKYARQIALLICSVSLIGCAGNRPKLHVDKLPLSDRISIGEVAVYEGLKTDREADLNDPYYVELLNSYLENMKKNLKENDFSVESAGCSDCLVIKTKLNNKKPLLGGALGIMGLGAIRARIEVYDKNVLVYSHAAEVVTDLFFGPAAQIRRGVALMLVKQLRKNFHPNGEKK